ncbi:hypothetical protein [Collinsella tanakaei]
MGIAIYANGPVASMVAGPFLFGRGTAVFLVDDAAAGLIASAW